MQAALAGCLRAFCSALFAALPVSQEAI